MEYGSTSRDKRFRRTGREVVGHVEGARGLRRIFVRDLVLSAQIGVHLHEYGRFQRICVNLDLTVDDDVADRAAPDAAACPWALPGGEEMGDVVDYEVIVSGIRRLVGTGHVGLVETLAERLAELCLADSRVAIVQVIVEKLEVFEDAQSAGVVVERWR